MVQTVSKILEGTTILDLSSLITGPYCASLLGDLGAHVVKVEHPAGGDPLRHLGSHVDGESTLFIAVNRNKEGVTLDLGTEAGRDMLAEMIQDADVVIENFRPDMKKEYRLTYADLRKKNDKIIHLSITGFGEDGPYALKPGTDHVFQGLSGMMAVSGEAENGPLRVGVPVADMTAALYATVGVLAALHHRKIAGEGQQVCINLLDAAMCLQTIMITDYLLTGKEPVQCGNDSPFAYPVGVFKTRNGYLSLSAFNNKFWKGLCRALGLETLISDPMFTTPHDRFEQKGKLKPILERRFLRETTEKWLELLEQCDVPCGHVHDYESLIKDPQVVHNDLIKTLPHAVLGKIKTLGNPIRFGKTPAEEAIASPVLSK